MRVFVTGSSGLLGRNLLPLLVQKDHEVVALVRSPERARELAGPKVRLVAGDLRAVSAFEDALSEATVLIHAGACFSEHYALVDSGSLPFDVNLQGTLALLDAAYRHGIRSVIYVSSGGVLQPSDESVMDETRPYDTTTRDRYFQSKIAAEQAVLKFASEHPEMRIVLILPSIMVGPHDVSPTPTGGFLRAVALGEVKMLLPGSMSIVDARDVAHTIVAAMDKGQSGDRFVVGGHCVPVSEVISTVARLAGREPPTHRPPAGVLFALAHVMGVVSKVTRKPPPLRASTLERLQRNLRWDSSKAERTMGVQWRPVEETLRDTVHWFLQQREQRSEGHAPRPKSKPQLRSSPSARV